MTSFDILADRTILITGGTGSFGNAVVRRFLTSAIREIRIFSRDESKQEEMRVALGDSRVKFYLGDVREYGGVHDAMRGVDLVFHAAALKQVPSCEFYPLEAVRTNVLGAENVINAAVANGVQRVIALSTDKAVYPINAMGLSKAMMEKLVIAKSRTLSVGQTVLCATRYGNVMASRGSVIPLFVRQLKQGEELTVTDPAMTRFLMSLADSVELVLYAYRNARQGDIFVQKAPACTVGDLAEALRVTFRKRNPIRVIGTRHGEKLYEFAGLARGDDAGGGSRPVLPGTGGQPGLELFALFYRRGGEHLTGRGLYFAQCRTAGRDPRGRSALTTGLHPAGTGVRPPADADLRRARVLRKIVTIVGTRPELIKMSLVIERLDRLTRHVLVHTGQNHDHELNQIFFDDLGIRRPDHFLEAAGAGPMETIAHILVAADRVLAQEQPDAVLIYGDTNSGLAVIPAKRRQIPVFHMEAGNRCFDQRVPEELNRKVIDHLSDVNMVLTEHARRYLLAEGLPGERIFKVGSHMAEVLARHRERIEASPILDALGLRTGEFFLVSAHREENVDPPARLEALLASLNALAEAYGYPVIVSTHPRTRKRLAAETEIARSLSPLIRFLPPFGFTDYIRLQLAAYCVLSDSGTITEEASLLDIPAVTMRDAHERPEGVDAGTLIMASLDPARLLDAVRTVRDGFAGTRRYAGRVPDYEAEAVSAKVARIVLSYIDQVNRVVWSKP